MLYIVYSQNKHRTGQVCTGLALCTEIPISAIHRASPVYSQSKYALHRASPVCWLPILAILCIDTASKHLPLSSIVCKFHTSYATKSQYIPSSLATADPHLMKQCRSCWRLVLVSHNSQLKCWSSLQTSLWTSTSLVDMWHLQRSHILHSGCRWVCLDRGGILYIWQLSLNSMHAHKISFHHV